MRVPEHVFRAYDIRGIFPTEINAELAYAVANQFVGFLGKAQRILVVHDARVSSPELAKAVAAGLEAAGATAIEAGLGPTDLFYYGCATLNCPGIMVTASHNPPEYGGFKIVRKMPYALSLEEGIGELRRRIQEEESVRAEGGKCESVDLYPGFIEYVSGVVGQFSQSRPAVIDTGNGAAGPATLRLKEAMNLNLDVMFPEPDGRFPNRGPDPMKPENIAPLVHRVKALGASIGVAIDGDGDRAIAVDPDGEPVPGDFVAALLAQNALKRSPGKPVLYDVRCSRAVRDIIERNGGKPLVNRVGHVYMKSRLAEEHAAFAGELSGHYYFPEFFGADSGLLAALYLVRMASEFGDRWEEQLRSLRSSYHVSGEINFRVENAQDVISRLRTKFENAKISEVDGVTFDSGDWWFNVRLSNTEPLLRLNLEANTPDALMQHINEVTQVIKSN